MVEIMKLKSLLKFIISGVKKSSPNIDELPPVVLSKKRKKVLFYQEALAVAFF